MGAALHPRCFVFCGWIVASHCQPQVPPVPRLPGMSPLAVPILCQCLSCRPSHWPLGDSVLWQQAPPQRTSTLPGLDAGGLVSPEAPLPGLQAVTAPRGHLCRSIALLTGHFGPVPTVPPSPHRSIRMLKTCPPCGGTRQWGLLEGGGPVRDECPPERPGERLARWKTSRKTFGQRIGTGERKALSSAYDKDRGAQGGVFPS